MQRFKLRHVARHYDRVDLERYPLRDVDLFAQLEPRAKRLR